MTASRIFKQVPRVLFGAGSLARLPELLPEASDSGGYVAYVIDDVLDGQGIVGRLSATDRDVIEWFPASAKEPSTDQVDAARDRVLAARGELLPRAVVGIGGGSTMDVAKALSVLLRNPGPAGAYQGWDLVAAPGVYKVGVPTIAGSGAEASRTAVLMARDRKQGINSDHSMFDAIILDSSLIGGVPRAQRFHSGMDCYIHCVESLHGTMLNELSRAVAGKALELCEAVFLGDGTDDMLMTASYLGGVSIVNSEVGVCHALSYGLSVELGLRHGFANCIAFDVLDEYYGPSVARFRAMLERHRIALPRGVCRPLDGAALDRMVEMTWRMERPLINALGPEWKRIMTREKILGLYEAM